MAHTKDLYSVKDTVPNLLSWINTPLKAMNRTEVRNRLLADIPRTTFLPTGQRTQKDFNKEMKANLNSISRDANYTSYTQGQMGASSFTLNLTTLWSIENNGQTSKSLRFMYFDDDLKLKGFCVTFFPDNPAEFAISFATNPLQQSELNEHFVIATPGLLAMKYPVGNHNPYDIQPQLYSQDLMKTLEENLESDEILNFLKNIFENNEPNIDLLNQKDELISNYTEIIGNLAIFYNKLDQYPEPIKKEAQYFFDETERNINLLDNPNLSFNDFLKKVITFEIRAAEIDDNFEMDDDLFSWITSGYFTKDIMKQFSQSKGMERIISECFNRPFNNVSRANFLIKALKYPAFEVRLKELMSKEQNEQINLVKNYFKKEDKQNALVNIFKQKTIDKKQISLDTKKIVADIVSNQLEPSDLNRVLTSMGLPNIEIQSLFKTIQNNIQEQDSFLSLIQTADLDIKAVISKLLQAEDPSSLLDILHDDKRKDEVTTTMRTMYENLETAGNSFLPSSAMAQLFTLDNDASIDSAKRYAGALKQFIHVLEMEDSKTQKTHAQKLMEHPTPKWLQFFEVVANILFGIIPIIGWIGVALQAHESYKETGSANYVFAHKGDKLAEAIKSELSTNIYKQVMREMKEEDKDEAPKDSQKFSSHR